MFRNQRPVYSIRGLFGAISLISIWRSLDVHEKVNIWSSSFFDCGEVIYCIESDMCRREFTTEKK